MDEVYIGVRSWWSYLIAGLIAIAFGIILLAWPSSTVKVLAYTVGILALLQGIVEVIFAFVLLSKKEKMAWLLTSGLLSLFIGILLLTKTGFALTLVVVLIAVWSIIVGVVELVAGIEMPPKSGRGWVAVSGVLSIILGILLLTLTMETVYAIIVVLSIFLIAGGIVRLILAFYARKFQKEILAA
jgi:uncharacterized membrane protein HdeD (DUF308 family)